MELITNQNLKREKVQDPFSIREGLMKDGSIGKSYRLSWTEEMFIPGSGGWKTLGRTFSMKRLYLAAYLMAALILLIIGRSAWLQIAKGEYYRGMAEGNRIRTARIEAKRGIVYDRDGKPLVRNVANFLLYFLPSDLPADKDKKDAIIERISAILGDMSAEEINAKLAEAPKGSFEFYAPLFIDDNIDYEKAMLLHLESDNMPGVVLSNSTRREYALASPSMSHILGYVGKINQKELDKKGEKYLPIDYIGKNGLEYFWEDELRGINGEKFVEVDAMGKEKKIISFNDPQDGRNLVLTIDSELQKKTEETLLAEMEKLKLKRASAIIIDPKNGEILALVSLPAFDNSLFARGITTDEYKQLIEDPDLPLFNRAVSGEFPSGSTIKPVLAAAALEEGIIDENTSFQSGGGIRVGSWFFPDWKAGGHGATNVRKAIAQSVNTFFYIIGGGYQDFVGLGPERIVKYEKLFGLGDQLGIDLPGEAKGFLPTKEWKEETFGEKWYIGNTYNVSIGQGDTLVTPLQVAAFTSYFAANGKLFRPHLVKQVLDSGDNLLYETELKPIRENVIKDYNTRIVREGMRQTVTSGSAASLSALPVEAAGKTGTAQWSSKKETHAWFTGFAPYDNPELAITILVEEGGEGSHTAVPIAKEILNWHFGGRNASSTDIIIE